MKQVFFIPRHALLLGATALAGVTPFAAVTQTAPDCRQLVNGTYLAEGCEQPNQDTVVRMPAGENTEKDRGKVTNNAGFVLAIDGEPINADPRIEDRIRSTDIALAEADVKVTYDGLDVEPRLDLVALGGNQARRPGEAVTFQSRTNYPAYVAKAEVRIYDRAPSGAIRLVKVAPIPANGQANVILPAGTHLSVVHRVYDAKGRYDETQALPLWVADDRGLNTRVEEGSDATATRNIRVNGGAVTVSATNLRSGARLKALGEEIAPDANGGVVIQRILPAGTHEVDVSVTGNGAPKQFSRDVDVAGPEWFYFGVADVTYSHTKDGATGESDSQTRARLTYYIDGETESGYQITSSLDTGDEEIGDLFRRLDEKDPRAVLLRVDPLDGYPTYGDDSTIRDNTPTSGKFYLKIERDGNFALWGDYQASVSGSGYLRNERTLYGLQGKYATQQQTSFGEARAEVEVYAAQPEQQVGRDVLRGTGGSVYFLKQQDLSVGTETITVEVRDAATNRVTQRERLVFGRDYSINYLQGVIVLTRPLSSTGASRLIETQPGGDTINNLVVQYEFTPTSGDVDGFSYGGRVQTWASDNLRVGVTALKDTTGVEDHTSAAIDLRYRLGDRSYVQLDYAETDGSAFASSNSLTGGLIIDSNETTARGASGSAIKVEGVFDLAELGFQREGTLSAYFEEREQGFSTLDYQVTATTGDETLYGFDLDVEARQGGLGWGVYADFYENDVGDERTEVGVEVNGQLTDRLKIAVALEHLDERNATRNGTRLDGAVRLSYQLNDTTTLSAFGQHSVKVNGLQKYNRYGVGVAVALQNGWSVDAELSDGTGGVGGRILATHRRDENSSTYFGYDLDPGRAIDAGLPAQSNAGKYVVGGTRQITDAFGYFGENTYDLLGEQRTLTSAYGVNYQRSKFLKYTAAIEFGQIVNGTDNDFDQTALSLGMQYQDDWLTAVARFEYRKDDGTISGADRDADTIALVANGKYKIDENRRLVFNLSAIDTNANDSLLDGRLVDASIGYALRPVNNERLNILARYRYLNDSYGQEIDGVAGAGAVQESHVFSLEGSYDLDEYWTLGAKVGGRFTNSAGARGEALTSNDAWIAIFNARYHLVHNWDLLVEGRYFEAKDAGTSEASALIAGYRHVGNNAKIGIGYNFGNFSDDLTDLTHDDKGIFVNLIAKF